MTYIITNAVPSEDGQYVTVFYRYDDGTEHSNKFPSTATAMDIMTWGTDHGNALAAAREAAVARAQELAMAVTTEGE
jgi:hypothetical protein